MGPINPESLTTFSNRSRATGTAPTARPIAKKNLASGLPSFNTRNCSSGDRHARPRKAEKNPAFYERVKGEDTAKTEKNAAEFLQRLKEYAYAQPSKAHQRPRPPAATQQAPFAPIYGNGPATTYQHTFEQGE